MRQNDYQKCLKEITRLDRFGIKLGLDVISSILKKLHNPQDSFSCIHIAGTNGKGSIAAALSAILHNAGLNVGLYTSPHLVSFNERICIRNNTISNDEVISAHEAVKSAQTSSRQPTFFEHTTAMALYVFEKSKVDWAVIETGMGGRLDATNIVSPEIAIISNISLEHQSYLGHTIAQIACEKGGIIKKKTPVVTGARQKDAVRVLKQIASDQSAPFYRLGEHFKVRRLGNGNFSYFGLDHIWRNLHPSLPGWHQIDNAAIVLAACEILQKNCPVIGFDAIQNGIETFKWPGRIEIFPVSPVIILDGAHNLTGARSLANFLSKDMKGKNITMIIGILDDKPYFSMLKSLAPVCNRIIVTRPKTDRGLSTETLLSAVRKLGRDAEVLGDVAEAVNAAFETTPSNEIVCITGSLYVVGEAKQAISIRGIQSS